MNSVEGTSGIGIFWGYVRHHVKSISLFCIFIIIFSIVFSLYDLPGEAVIYAVVLCAAVGIILVTVDFLHYYRKLRTLEALSNCANLEVQKIPEGQNLMERGYCGIIESLINERTKLISENDFARSEMIDYYTLWAHQIKTPIAAIGLLLQGEDSPENKQFSSELFKIEQYVNMALSYLRLESDTTDYIIRQCSLDEIVKQAVHKYAPLFIRKKLSLDLAPLDCAVLTDEKWLSFVIEQLLSNALKYTAKGKISISMAADGGRLIIEDTGIGIAEENLPRLCQKGFTGGRADKKATGIGLYLCKRILTKLSHSIAITSEVGSFTRVEITFSDNLTKV